MRQSELFAGLEPAKAAFADAVTAALRRLPEVKSVTCTGSFVELPGLAGISDIDVVVVVTALTEANFCACKAAVAQISPATLGLANHRLVLNDSFGPLKFDEPGVVVVHLMVYDLAGHREHVLQSPFTCLDWERSPHWAGCALRDLCPVLNLQPRQFFEARRSLAGYLEDIAAGVITYRRHDFGPDGRRERLERLPLDVRHQGEYSYHIVHNLVSNYAKLVRQQNARLAESELLDFWRQHLAPCAEFVGWFEQLAAVKQARGREFPADTLDRTRGFLAAFSASLQETWGRRATRHLLVRHARTALNDGTFLGQLRDPPLLEAPAPLAESPSRVIASPALRCRQTAAALAPGAALEVDALLSEINYGAAEGLTYAELRERQPAIIAGWARGEDPRFPGGENTADVAARLQTALDALDARPTLVVTHNVVMRCLLGRNLGVPPAAWHRLPVDHLEVVPVLRLEGRTYLDLTPGQLASLTDALVAPAP